MSPRAFAYCRVSTVDQARDEAGSIDAQRVVCNAVAGLHSLTIAEEFTDEGVSGAKAMADRPAGGRLLATVQAGDFVIASKMDRMFRSTENALAVARDLADRGVKLILRDVSADPVNTNGTGAFFFTVLAAMTTMERETIRERTMMGRSAKIANGGHGGGEAPFGWRIVGKGRDARREENPVEQAALVKMRAMRSEGKKLEEIAAALGPVSRAGKPLVASAVGRILTRDA